MPPTNSNIDEDLKTAPRRFSNDIRCIGSFFLSFADSEVEKAYINDMTSQAMQARKPFAKAFGSMALAAFLMQLANNIGPEETAETPVFPLQLMLTLAMIITVLCCI